MVRGQELVPRERLRARLIAFVYNLSIPRVHPAAYNQRLVVATSDTECPFRKRSQRHRSFRSVRAARIQPNLNQHGGWTHNEESVKRRVDDLV